MRSLPAAADKSVVHEGTLRGSLVLFGIFLLLGVVLGLDLPEVYPTRFDFSGTPTEWSEGPGNWIALVTVGAFCFGQGFLLQRFLLNDPDSDLLNLPRKEQFKRLTRERKVLVVRRLNRMLGAINIGTLLIFTCVLLSIYLSARFPDSLAPRTGDVAIWLIVAGILVYPILEIMGVRKMIVRAIEEEGEASR